MSVFISRAVFKAKPVPKANALNNLGFETTIPLFAGLFIAFSLMRESPTLAFSFFAAIIGARYFAFATLYRDRTYWALGSVIFAVGFAFARGGQAFPLNVVIWTGIAELAFAGALFARWRSEQI